MPIPNLYRYLGEDLESGKKAKPFDVRGATAQRDYTRTFKVLGLHQRCTGQMACWEIPVRPMDVYATATDFDPWAYCVAIESETVPDTDGLLFKITCSYSTNISYKNLNYNQFPVDQNGNPTRGPHNQPELEVPELEWEFEEVGKHEFADLDEKPYLNSAFQPFLNLPPTPLHRSVLTLTRNEMRYSPDIATNYAGSVNDGDFLGYPRDTVLCMAPRVRLKNDKGASAYWRVTYRFKFGYKKKGILEEDAGTPEYESFQHRELDQGYCERRLIPSSDPITAEELALAAALGINAVVKRKSVPIPIIPSGTTQHRPSLLDGKGRKQTLFAVDANGNELYPVPVYIQFRNRRRLDFKKLFQYGLGGQYPPPRP